MYLRMIALILLAGLPSSCGSNHNNAIKSTDLTTSELSVGQQGSPTQCNRDYIKNIGQTQIWQNLGKDNAYFYQSKMGVDADGAPNAYHPNGKGLDYLANAGKPGNWWGIATSNGEPVVQKNTDPFPGYYVSVTALIDGNYSVTNPLRYVDATQIPYIVLPPGEQRTGARLGDIAFVYNTQNGRSSFAIYADSGPKNEIGEGSIALAAQLGINSSAKKGGQASGVIYLVFVGSGDKKVKTVEEIDTIGGARLVTFGGRSNLLSCFGIADTDQDSEPLPAAEEEDAEAFSENDLLD